MYMYILFTAFYTQMSALSRKYFKCTRDMYNLLGSQQPDTTKIRVFFNAIYYVAPNPQLRDVVAALQTLYDEGRYFEYRDLYIPNEFYNCGDYWSC